MREYESIFVLNPTVDDAQVDVEVGKITEFLTGRNSEVTEVQKWGRRKLAYEINTHKEGISTLIRFSSETDVPVELDRRYRLNENMLRFMTVLYERPPVEEAPGEEEGEGEAPRRAARRPAPAPDADNAEETEENQDQE